jgi:hypothetical protein
MSHLRSWLIDRVSLEAEIHYQRGSMQENHWIDDVLAAMGTE